MTRREEQVPPPSPRRRANRVEPRVGGTSPSRPPCGGRQPSSGGRRSGPSGPTRTPLDAEAVQPGEAKRPTLAHGPGMRRGGARAAHRGRDPGGGAARPRSEIERSGGPTRGAETRSWPTSPECVAVRRRGKDPGGSAGSWSEAKTCWPAVLPDKAYVSAETCKGRK
jgi:hypothetical protein